MDQLQEYPFAQPDSLDFSKLERKMRTIEMTRLSDDLAFLQAH